MARRLYSTKNVEGEGGLGVLYLRLRLYEGVSGRGRMVGMGWMVGMDWIVGMVGLVY